MCNTYEHKPLAQTNASLKPSKEYQVTTQVIIIINLRVLRDATEPEETQGQKDQPHTSRGSGRHKQVE